MTFEYSNRGRLPESDELLLKEETVRLKRCIYAAQRKSLPPITTHNVQDDTVDPVLNALRRCHLFNDTHDRVKVSWFKFHCRLPLGIQHHFVIVLFYVKKERKKKVISVEHTKICIVIMFS